MAAYTAGKHGGAGEFNYRGLPAIQRDGPT